ncbi:MAG TPA: hypothetical protein VHB98_22290, partial [Chloroflexota bacterium]|nr:hypothetical protein [Chloroflexota bacterium]
QSPAGQLSLTIAPYQLTEPYTLQAALAADAPRDRLHVWVADSTGRRCASGYLDVVVADKKGG